MVNTPSAPCHLGREITVRGTLVGEEDLVVEGRLEGRVALAGHLTVAEPGILEADIEVDSIEVHGQVVGDIIATRSITIAQAARVDGNVRAPRVMISDGAQFRGKVEMVVDLPDHLAKVINR